MLNKIQITLCILAGVAIVVFITAICTNHQVKTFGPTPGWVDLVVLGAFGLTVASSLGVVVTQILEFREPKPKKAEDEALAGEETPADEMAPVGVMADDESIAEVDAAADTEVTSDFDATSEFEAPSEFEATSEFATGTADEATTQFESHEETVDEAPEFGEFTTDFTDFEDEK